MSRVIIIGGGPAGLITLHYFKQAHRFFPGIRPFEVKLFESQDGIGGTLKYRTYKGAELVSSKYLTAFSEWRFGPDVPDFLPPEDYIQYLENFAAENGLYENIECRTKVVKVTRQQNKGGDGPEHVVTVESVDQTRTRTVEHRCDVLIVCTGLNVTPHIPRDVPGLETISDGASGNPPFRVLHSSDFKNKEGNENEFHGKSTVVVLGVGETGHDIAHFAVTHPDVKRVLLCHRDGFFLGPKVVPWPLLLGRFGKRTELQGPNKPTDVSTASLFDTAYVHPLLQRSPLLWEYYDKWTKGIFWMITGTTVGCDQWAGGIGWGRRHIDSLFAVKTSRAIPYISKPFRGRGLLWPIEWLRSSLINIEIPETGPDQVIELAPWPTKVEGGIMAFEENGSVESRQLQKNIQKTGPVRPDVVVMATGYRKTFPFLDESYPALDQAKVRGIYREIEDGLAYIGFMRPGIGAIPPLTELQAQLFISRWIQHQGARIAAPDPESLSRVYSRTFQHQNSVAPYELDYALHARGGYDFARNKGGVDHESYAYQLALDMGAAPTASHVWCAFGWKVFFTWAMGPNFNTKFRLVGPWAAPEKARSIMENEQFNIVKRTGGLVFFVTYTIIPMVVFGWLSLVVNTVARTWHILVLGGLLYLGLLLLGTLARAPYA